MKYAFFAVAALGFASCLPVCGVAQSAAIEKDLQRRMQDMRALESYSRRRSEKDRREMEAMNPPGLDKNARERVRKMRMLDTRDVDRYKAFLTAAKTGIFKIFPNFDCVSKTVVNIGGECAGYVPETSDFSFRSVAYTNRLYHDIGFERTGIISDSFFSQGILISLGDVPIEKVALELAEMKYLLGFKPDALVANAKQTSHSLYTGVDSNGFHYSSSVTPSENTTYVLRNIAYRFSNSLAPLSPDSTLTEIKFKSLELDARDDVIVVFRIIRKDDDGGLTIVWKELGRKEGPKLKFGKGEAITDFK